MQGFPNRKTSSSPFDYSGNARGSTFFSVSAELTELTELKIDRQNRNVCDEDTFERKQKMHSNTRACVPQSFFPRICLESQSPTVAPLNFERIKTLTSCLRIAQRIRSSKREQRISAESLLSEIFFIKFAFSPLHYFRIALRYLSPSPSVPDLRAYAFLLRICIHVTISRRILNIEEVDFSRLDICMINVPFPDADKK